MRWLVKGLLILMALPWTQAIASAACELDGKEYSEGWAFKQPGGLAMLCEGATWTLKETALPYEIRSAELKSLEDPSQRPRCNAKELIESICGKADWCEFEVRTDLCADPNVAEVTTHIDIVWRCRVDGNWHFQRSERGQNIVLDCRK